MRKKSKPRDQGIAKQGGRDHSKLESGTVGSDRRSADFMSNLNVMTGHPFRGENLRNLKIFLKRMGIIYDDNIEYSICLLDGNCRIVGSGSVETDVIKCVAIDRGYQGRGLMSVMISELIQYQFEKGRTHIFVYTKPENQPVCADMGFYMVHRTKDGVRLEDRGDGFSGGRR